MHKSSFWRNVFPNFSFSVSAFHFRFPFQASVSVFCFTCPCLLTRKLLHTSFAIPYDVSNACIVWISLKTLCSSVLATFAQGPPPSTYGQNEQQ